MSPSRQHLPLAGFLISFTGAVLFSTKAIIIKKAFQATSVDALTLLSLRMLFSLPFYTLAALWGRRVRVVEGSIGRGSVGQGSVGQPEGLSDSQAPRMASSMTSRQWMWIIVLGILGYHFSSYFDFAGLQYISAGLERLILFLYPSFAVLINAVVFRQRISRVQGLALLLTYTGIGIAYFGELKVDAGNAQFYWGSFLVFLCAVTYAFYLSGMGRVVRVVSPFTFTTYSMLVAVGSVFLHFLVRGWVSGNFHLPTGAASGQLWMYGLLLALLATVIPSFMLSEGMRRIGANNAAIVTSVGPVSTILQAHFILGDPIFIEQVIGTLLVIAGVLLTGWKGR
ncbi:DMT family transporter [Flavitalea sp. BT771]|uniref:DMT family transporter n=1 Tax=Flavitalea sp. BT771 TaxID=3063329 RepID=UPI0026E26215|nr:DMT family transporter [Flavitalea sp. BT771]MDO6430211.1 DMT family transporter [Flavitalea sp. BT771]MDV6219650.1 DMT family transporter [Flavitalea sp. BT771]